MNDLFPLSLGSRCINKEWFFLPMDEVWSIMEDYLYLVHHMYGLQIHVFTLMQNHYHLLASAPHGNLTEAMRYFHSQTGRVLAYNAQRINQVWHRPFFRNKIGNPHYYLTAYKYFYRNPVEAGLCERVEDYPYSTLYGLLGRRKLIIPVMEDETLFSDVEGTLRWLNSAPHPEHREVVRRALRKKEFNLPRDPHTGYKHQLEESLY